MNFINDEQSSLLIPFSSNQNASMDGLNYRYSNTNFLGLEADTDFMSGDTAQTLRKGKTILFVGEHAEQRSLDFAEFTYTKYCFATAFEAVSFLEENTSPKEGKQIIDAILCDMQLNDSDAVDLFTRIKAIDENIPFIALTEKANSEEMMKCLKAGIDDYYEFEIDAHTLDSKIGFLQQFKAQIRACNPMPELFENDKSQTSFVKRFFDLFLAGIILVMISPILLIVAILIKIDSRGPIFYTSRRVGAGYKTFDFYKFRSMRVGAEKELKDLLHLNQYAEKGLRVEGASPELDTDICLDCLSSGNACAFKKTINGQEVCEKLYKEQKSVREEKQKAAFIKIDNDPRVTAFGRFIRKTSLDELPQLLNVLKGDMSIVGNRPLPIYEAEQLTTDKHVKRFLAPAGITGLWQVTRRGQADMSEEERIELDKTYADKHSLWMDMKILLKTLPAAIQKEAV